MKLYAHASRIGTNLYKAYIQTVPDHTTIRKYHLRVFYLDITQYLKFEVKLGHPIIIGLQEYTGN